MFKAKSSAYQIFSTVSPMGITVTSSEVLHFSSNIDRFQQGIDTGDLPKTFRDAVHITRSIGVRFLWIDSLCIVQNDVEDWERESKLMEIFFSSAYLTIDEEIHDYESRPYTSYNSDSRIFSYLKLANYTLQLVRYDFRPLS